MSNSLPTRPNLDHLREQAKDLLSSFKAGNAEAIAEFQLQLPSISHLSSEAASQQHLSLSDAQSAVARKHGFASWPKLVNHVESLRAIEGTWIFTSLEVEGNKYPEGAFRNSSLTIDGDSFLMVSAEATYSGVCVIDVCIEPHTIDIHFTEGPEAGNSSFGIYEFDGRELKICLGLTGVARPNEFATKPGSGQALETLRRGQPAEAGDFQTPCEELDHFDDLAEGFGQLTPELEAIQGEWAPLSIIKDGMALPMQFFGSGKRVMVGAESTVSFAGQVYMQALTRVDASTQPISVDYLLTAGLSKGQFQLGIMEWENDLLRVCFAEPGSLRPKTFESEFGSGHTLTVWQRTA